MVLEEYGVGKGAGVYAVELEAILDYSSTLAYFEQWVLWYSIGAEAWLRRNTTGGPGSALTAEGKTSLNAQGLFKTDEDESETELGKGAGVYNSDSEMGFDYSSMLAFFEQWVLWYFNRSRGVVKY